MINLYKCACLHCGSNMTGWPRRQCGPAHESAARQGHWTVVVAFSHEKAYFEVPMRYTKLALLIFGFGLVLGLVVVVAELKALERVASGTMALGIVAIPISILADLRRGLTARFGGVTRRAKAPPRRVPAMPHRPRKSARMKR
jgi:hypothetical protein